jgi:hypothetical protein
MGEKRIIERWVVEEKLSDPLLQQSSSSDIWALLR